MDALTFASKLVQSKVWGGVLVGREEEGKLPALQSLKSGVKSVVKVWQLSILFLVSSSA